MEGFSYTNIFETKGIEYIAIIAFFLVLIPFWIILNRKGKLKLRIKKILNVLSFDLLNIPQGVFHSKNHTWAYLEKSGAASVGLDDFLLHIIGFVRFEKLRMPNDMIKKGELLAELVNDDKTLKIFSPISGRILNTNFNLNEDPALFYDDPYNKGWVYKIKPTKWKNEVNTLFLAEETKYWSESEFLKFREFILQSNIKYSKESSFAVLQDGGNLIDYPLSELSKDVWNDFQKIFLNYQN